MSERRPLPGTPEAKKWVAKEAACSVFISVAEEDRDEGVRVRDALASQGVRAWLFKDRQFPGFDWLVDVEYGVLEHSDAAVYLISKSFIQSGPCKQELRIGAAPNRTEGAGPTLNIAIVIDDSDLGGLSQWDQIGTNDQLILRRVPEDAELAQLARHIAGWLGLRGEGDGDQPAPPSMCSGAVTGTKPADADALYTVHDHGAEKRIRITQTHPLARPLSLVLTVRYHMKPDSSRCWRMTTDQFEHSFKAAVADVLRDAKHEQGAQ